MRRIGRRGSLQSFVMQRSLPLATSLLALSLFACGGSDPAQSFSSSGGNAGSAGSSAGGASAGGAAGSSSAGSSSGGSSTAGSSSGGASGGSAGSASGGTSSGGTTSSGAEPPVVGGVRFLGRVDTTDAGGPTFAWTMSGLMATVSGTTISAKVGTENTDKIFFQPVIDGEVKSRMEAPMGQTDLVLASGLSDGPHVVELYRENEGQFGKSRFLGFTSGTVQAAPAARGRLIEVYGDSISAGYGNLGSETHIGWTSTQNACHLTPETQAGYMTYGAIAARAVDADVSVVAVSGWGLYRDLGGGMTSLIPNVYTNTLGPSASTPAWSFAQKADLVVINLGTNDVGGGKGDPGQPYEDAYLTFIANLRTHYPDAWIFLTIGPMLGTSELAYMNPHLANVVNARAALGDTKVTSFDYGTQPVGSNGEVPTGCDWHPNVAEDQAMADILTAKIQEKLGW